VKRENPQIKTLVSFGGGSGSAEFPALAADCTSRATFVQEARQFVERHSLDGVDSTIPSIVSASCVMPWLA